MTLEAVIMTTPRTGTPHLANVRHFPIPNPGDKPGVWHQVKIPLASPSPGL